MKKVVLSALLAASSVGAWSADYVGASYGLSQLSGCAAGAECDGLGRSFKLLAATDAPEKLQAIGIKSVEVSFARMGAAKQRYTALLPVQLQDNIDAGTPVSGGFTEERQASSMGLSLVSRHQLTQGLSFTARFGVAYTTSTKTTHVSVSYEDDNAVLQTYQGRVQEVSTSKLAPLLGAGLEYEIAPGTRLSTGLEMTRYSGNGDSAPYWQLYLGVMQAL